MKLIACFSIFFLLLGNTTQSISVARKVLGHPKVDHSEWDSLLRKHISDNGKVNYKGFKSDAKKLDTYLRYLSKIPITSYPEKEQLAYWINAYNAFTVDMVANNYPVKSIKDIRNGKSLVAKLTGSSQVWIEKLRYAFAGEELSLYNIENTKLLKNLFDPRIHFVINCASYSCPRLWNRAYTADNVDRVMDLMASEFINDPRKNKISVSTLQLSQIFEWYTDDFTRNSSLIEYLNKYSNIKINAGAKLNFIDYNWSLNE
ncbi:MAG TPA: DUF547 domain-containing protein [Daejeonella sp.]|nr:DUF547 domain-containing protein [Daejeonella sp.]